MLIMELHSLICFSVLLASRCLKIGTFVLIKVLLTYVLPTYAKWTTNVEYVFRKCVRVSYFGNETSKVIKSVPITSNSPAIFPGLLKPNFTLLYSSIKLIGLVGGQSFSYLTNLVCERHLKASSITELCPSGAITNSG